MKGFSVLALAFLFALGVSCQSSKKNGEADTVFLNGFLWTVDPNQPKAEALAVKDNKILSVGSSSEIKKMIGDTTRVIDLKGAFVLPGFTDCHTHFIDGGFSLSSIQLGDVRSKEGFRDRIKGKARELGPNAWILNGNWDHQRFDPPELPSKEWIDDVTPDNPVCVNRLDGHMVLANSLALKLAGISQSTAAPEGGEIVKDPQTGEPTGILKDAAMDLVMGHVPDPTLEERMGAATAALKEANRFGVTSIHDMGYVSSFDVYQKLLDQGRLTARLKIYIPIREIERLTGANKESFPENDFLKIAGLKGFVDGSLGSSTALFFDPYSDDPEKRGIMVSDMFPEGIMEKRIMEADRAGLQVAVHAIGDRANHVILDIFEKAMQTNGERDRRWRIEHAQHLIPEDFERFGKLGIIASVQPYHAIDDGRWAEKKIGKERARYTNAFRTLLDHGTLLACGSDWTVAPLNPLTGIYAAVTRRTLDGKNPEGWIPEQKISLEEAIKGYTLNAAYAEFSEDKKGSIRQGKLADLVVLDQKLFEIPPEKIMETNVLMTVIDGKIVYQK
jgi:predicted amidohydrolase YtcJ